MLVHIGINNPKKKHKWDIEFVLWSDLNTLKDLYDALYCPSDHVFSQNPQDKDNRAYFFIENTFYYNEENKEIDEIISKYENEEESKIKILVENSDEITFN